MEKQQLTPRDLAIVLASLICGSTPPEKVEAIALLMGCDITSRAFKSHITNPKNPRVLELLEEMKGQQVL